MRQVSPAHQHFSKVNQKEEEVKYGYALLMVWGLLSGGCGSGLQEPEKEHVSGRGKIVDIDGGTIEQHLLGKNATGKVLKRTLKENLRAEKQHQ